LTLTRESVSPTSYLISTFYYQTQFSSVVKMPAIHASFDQGVRELQDATMAFLTNQYDNGDYVATADDIAELQAATAGFLADQTDGESFYLDGASHGLLH
jgi:hypothetical protein